MAASTTGVDGGLVVVSCDDPGEHSSQGEQDSRRYAKFARVPCLEPSTSQEAKDMVAHYLRHVFPNGYKAQIVATSREAAVRYFRKQNYEKAKEAFEKLAGGAAHEVASRAQVYLRMCEQKLGLGEAAPKTARIITT
jgi:hypothetical protein